jgi:hypothetical protein
MTRDRKMRLRLIKNSSALMGTAILAHVTEPGLEVLREVLPLFDWTGISLCPFLPRFDVLLLAYFAGGLIGDETQLLFARARTSAPMLVPVLELGPGFGEGWLEIMADQDGIVLPLHAVIRSDGWPLIHTATPALGIFEIQRRMRLSPVYCLGPQW